jgi:hypothetical protein
MNTTAAMADGMAGLEELQPTIDLYCRLTDHEGKVALLATRVWNAERFMLHSSIEANNSNAKNNSTKAKAEQLTAEQFFAVQPRRAA